MIHLGKKILALALGATLLALPFLSAGQSALPGAGMTMSILDDSIRFVREPSLFDGLEDAPSFGDSDSSWGADFDSGSFATSSAFPYSGVTKAIKDYQAINKDVMGWLYIPNTNINRPVLLSSMDNTYYAYRDWQGTNYPGTNYLNYTDTATYLDYRTKLAGSWDASSKNMVIYGHNWNNLRNPFVIGNKQGYIMFAQLPSYTSMEFAKANPHIYFSTGENEGIWRIFAVGYCELSPDFYYNQPNPNTADFQQIIDEWKARSIFNIGTDVNTGDRILTLSTCTRQYANASNLQRFVVAARLLRSGESETDAVSIAANTNVKQPKFDVAAGARAAA